MADNAKKAGKRDRERINVNQAYEVRDWAERLGVSETVLRKAVQKVGPMAADVRRRLGK